MVSNVIQFNNDENQFYKIGIKKQQQERYEEAITYFKKALEKDNDFLLVKRLSDCYIELSMFQEAENVLLGYYAKDFSQTEIFYDLSQLFIAARDPNKAFLFGLYYCIYNDDFEYFEQLTEMFEVVYTDKAEVEKESELFVAQHIFQYFFQNSNINMAIEWLDTLPYDIQTQKELRNLKAMGLLFIGRNEEAKAMLKQLLDEDDSDIHALCHYTLVLYNLHEKEAYDHYLSRLNKIHPILDDEKFKLGIVLSFLKQSEASQELLVPLYKKGKFKNAQMYHALSFNYFDLGELEKSEEYWEKFVEVTHAVSLSPGELFMMESYINQKIIPYLQDEDRHYRLLGIFLISRIKDKTPVITEEAWSIMENLPDYEKLYLSYIFHNLKLTKLDFIHRGLSLIAEKHYDEALMYQWIDRAEGILESRMDLKPIEPYVAVTYFLKERQENDQISKKAAIELFDTTRYHFMKVYEAFKQNNI